MQATYWNIFIWSFDLAFIDKLEDRAFDIYPWLDLDSIEVYPGNWPIANDIIYGIYYQVINSLNISDASKEKLLDWIFTNCIDSSINFNIDDFPPEEHMEIDQLSSL